jgi:CHAD domain-containing protein
MMVKKEFVGFRIFREEPLSRTYTRILDEQLKKLLFLNEQLSKSTDFATHEIRKSTKRIRAVYRIFRYAIGENQYACGKELYHQISLLLADHRISTVNIETLTQFARQKNLSSETSFIEDLIKNEQINHNNLTKSLVESQHIQKYLDETLRAELDHLNDLPDVFEFRQLVMGYKNSYGRCVNFLQIAAEQPATENLHNLRKAVKSLWNGMILIRPVWPSYIGYTIHNLDILGNRLGKDHDLAELDLRLNKLKGLNVNPHFDSLLGNINKKRQLIHKMIFPLAFRIFAEKTGSMSQKINRYYKVYMG